VQELDLVVQVVGFDHEGVPHVGPDGQVHLLDGADYLELLLEVLVLPLGHLLLGVIQPDVHHQVQILVQRLDYLVPRELVVDRHEADPDQVQVEVLLHQLHRELMHLFVNVLGRVELRLKQLLIVGHVHVLHISLLIQNLPK